MKTKFFLLVLLALFFCQTVQGVEIEGVNYSLNSKNSTAAVISKSPQYTGDIVIPASVEYNGINYDVTSIYSAAFYGCSGLTSVAIPNSVTSIGASAFESCSGLTSVAIPNSVTSIGGYAFNGCSGLTSVHISDLEAWRKISFRDVSSNPLYNAHHLYMNGSEISNLVIPEGVTTIGEYTFSGCRGLTSVFIPDGVTSIGEFAFYGCSGLSSISIPKSVTSIKKNAFESCRGLTKVVVPDISAWCAISFQNSSANPLHNAHHLYCDDNTEIINLIIPEGMTSIGNYAFYGCTNLASVFFPNSMNRIGNYAFSGCSRLTSVSIPRNVTVIGNYAFSECNSLISVFIGSSIGTIGNGAFSQSSNTSYQYPIKLKAFWCYAKSVPATYNIFGEKPRTENVTLYVPAESIEAYKNAEPWRNLENIVPLTEEDPSGSGNLYFSSTHVDAVLGEPFGAPAPSYISENVCLSSSDPLVAAVLADGVVLPISEGKAIITAEDQETGEKVDYQITVTFPSSSEGSSETVTVDEPGTLYIKMSDLESTDIRELILKGNLNAADINYIRSRVGRLQNLECLDLRDVTFVPGSEAYAQWSVSHDVGMGSTTYKYYFSDTNYTDRTSSMTGLGGGNVIYYIYNNRMDALLYGFSTLKKVVLPRTTKGISDYMFSGCSELISIDCPRDISFIGDEAFKGCEKLLSTNIPATVTDFGMNPFDGCKSLVHVGDLSHMKEISANAFKDCKNFVGNVMDLSLDLSGLDTIPDYAFCGCNLIHSIRFSPNLKFIGEYAITGDNNYIPKLTLPEGLTFIGNGALSGFKQLEDINIPNSLERAGASTLSGTRFRENLQPDNGIYYIGRIAVDAVNPDGDMTFRDGTVAIADNFKKKPSSVSFPASLRYIGKRAFYESNITELILPEGFEEIAQEAFRRASSLSKCELPSSLRIIRDYAFASSNITSITIPENVEKIGLGALACPRLLRIQYNAINASIVKYGDAYSNILVACESAALEKFLVGGKVQKLPQTLFSNGPYCHCENLLRVEFDEREEGVPLRVEDCLFYNCSKLISCPLPKGTTYIGRQAFSGCSSLPADFVFPEGLKEIGEEAFGYCTSFTKVVLPEGLVKLDDEAFSYCSGITEMDLPESLVYLGSKILYSATNNIQIHTIRINSTDLDRKCSGSFSGLKSLTRVEIGPKVKNLISRLFSGCENLETVEFADESSLEYIGYNTFYYSPWLKSKLNSDESVFLGRVLLYYRDNNQNTGNTTAVIPEGTVCLGGNSLSSFRGDSISLPSSLRYIVESAAERNSNLNTIVIPEGVKVIEKNAFHNCELKTIYLPSTLETIEKNAIYTDPNNIGTYRKRDSNLDIEIYSKATVPPVWEDDYETWEKEDLSHCKVFVPLNSMYDYDASGAWGLFNIYPYPDQDYIDSLPQLEDSNHQPTDNKWYDLQGRSYESRPNKTGIYIYKGKKVLIR